MNKILLLFIMLFVFLLKLNNGFIQISFEVVDEWNNLITALVEIESNGNKDAYNSAFQAAGVLQIRPIYVKEVNRILKEDKYTLEDRFDSIKSVEMFNIVQNFYNPEKDFKKAIQIHHGGVSRYKKNPNHNIWYYNKVIKYIKTNKK